MENTTQKTKLYLISHTHWDREWYQTFQRYRFRLVRMMDDLLDNLERDPDLRPARRQLPFFRSGG